ncbi:response regulator transcription factor [Thalassorhabdomicrobium marinisediminis]|uniref:Response regulator n=1 Tax=Thalassorhabdomicrobium marinisediminis TaxID=2170577 RepID=A0A2T7FVL7_9RHOB|nr:response regulator [Thalassorhabdomicrobium marinisediminis]PVA06194.1 response regulator [Thalassorhabdomicrobium marinisediminis]
MRILAVDDDPVILKILSLSFAQFGYEDVRFASSGEEALEMIEAAAEPFDVLLFDIMLPGISGVELCRTVRAQDAYRATPIVMITASRAHDIMEQAFHAGATDFVNKPFDGLELGSRIKLAVLLSDSLRRERQARHEMADLARLTAIAFDEPFKVSAGPAALELSVFENALLRKPDGLFAMTLFSVDIENAQKLYRKTSAAQFRRLIEDLAQHLSSVLPSAPTSFAHAGKGRFVCVTHGRSAPDLAALHARLDEWVQTSPGAEGPPLSLVVETISAQKLWSGRSAAAAVSDFVAQPSRRALLPTR